MKTTMKNLIGENVLITCGNWFYAPDGKQYRAVWGPLFSISEAKDKLGFSPGRAHANWFIEIGNMVITGCQVNYCLHCPEQPETGRVSHQLYGVGNIVSETILRDCEIYIAIWPAATSFNLWALPASPRWPPKAYHFARVRSCQGIRSPIHSRFPKSYSTIGHCST